MDSALSFHFLGFFFTRVTIKKWCRRHGVRRTLWLHGNAASDWTNSRPNRRREIKTLGYYDSSSSCLIGQHRWPIGWLLSWRLHQKRFWFHKQRGHPSAGSLCTQLPVRPSASCTRPYLLRAEDSKQFVSKLENKHPTIRSPQYYLYRKNCLA